MARMHTGDPLFDEHAADQAVITSLRREIKRLTEENTMSKVIKSTDNKFYVVHEYEEISREAAEDLLSRLRDDVTNLEDALQVLPAADAATPASPDAGTPTLADPNAVAPAAPAAPVDPAATAQPAVPAVNPGDAGGVAQTPPPPVDPNAPAPVLPPAPAAPADGTTPSIPAPAIQ